MPKQTKRKGSTLDRSAASTSAAATSASASASSPSSLKEWLKKPQATVKAPSPSSSAKAPSPSASFDAWLPKKPSSLASPKASSATSRPSKKLKQGSPQRASAPAPALPMESMTSSQFAHSIGRMPPAVQRQILERVDCVTLRRLYNTTSPDAAPAFREFLRTAVEALCPPVAPAAPRKPRRGPSSP